MSVSMQAADHYIRAGATGTASGDDWVNAWTSLPSTLQRGHTYYVAAGSYGGYTFNTAESGQTTITIKKAIESDHGTDTGWLPSYGAGQALFTGKLEFTTSNWIFDGRTGGGAGNWDKGFGFKIVETGDRNAVIRVNHTGSAHNITIRHVDMHGKGSSTTEGKYVSNDGIAIYNGASNITLSYAWIHETARCPVFITGSQNVLFEHIYVSSFYGTAEAHSEVMSAGQEPIGDVTWRHCLITAIVSTGGLMWNNSQQPASHLYVYGNVFYRPEGVTWDVANGLVGGWRSGLTSNIWVYNNTFINVDQPYQFCLSPYPETYSGNKAYNNIFFNCYSIDFSRFSDHDYNTFIDAGGTHSELHGISGSESLHNYFVDPYKLDFRLKTATDAGISVTSPVGINIDPMGITRGESDDWDRGAYEFISSASATPTIKSPLRKYGSTCSSFFYAIKATDNPVSFSAGPLPEGLSVDATSGVISGTPTSVGTSTVTIGASNEYGTGTADIEITITPTASIWSPDDAPVKPADPDNKPVELGVKFRSVVPGSVSGIRFYKGTGNTGTHIGNLWSSSGTKLASVTFTNETASGWQQANFATPVPVEANTLYVASYYAPNGHYAADLNGLTNGKDSSPLHAVSNAESSNGLYIYVSGGGFPTQTYSAINYWVDVIFDCTITTGIGQASKKMFPSITVYPNPASSDLKVITGFDMDKKSELYIYNILGKQLFRKKMNSPEKIIDVESLPDGVYLLRLQAENGTSAAQRFVVQH